MDKYNLEILNKVVFLSKQDCIIMKPKSIAKLAPRKKYIIKSKPISALTERIRKHLRDATDVITDEDIRNMPIGILSVPNPAGSY